MSRRNRAAAGAAGGFLYGKHDEAKKEACEKGYQHGQKESQ
jgi:hypothetical protein